MTSCLLSCAGFMAGIASLFSFAARGDAADTVKWSCYRNDRFAVLATDKTDSAGTKFIVRRSTAAIKADCEIESRATDLVLGAGAGEALWYISLINNVLVLDSGTGPDRTLVISDAASGKILLSAPYSVSATQCDPTVGCFSEEFRPDDAGVTFWRATSQTATAGNCPRLSQIVSDGLAPVIEEKTIFRFAPARLESLKTTRCVARQSKSDGRYILDGTPRD